MVKILKKETVNKFEILLKEDKDLKKQYVVQILDKRENYGGYNYTHDYEDYEHANYKYLEECEKFIMQRLERVRERKQIENPDSLLSKLIEEKKKREENKRI